MPDQHQSDLINNSSLSYFTQRKISNTEWAVAFSN